MFIKYISNNIHMWSLAVHCNNSYKNVYLWRPFQSTVVYTATKIIWGQVSKHLIIFATT